MCHDIAITNLSGLVQWGRSFWRFDEAHIHYILWKTHRQKCTFQM